MDINNLNENLCEKTFGGDLNVTVEPEAEKSLARQYRDMLHEMHGTELGMLHKVKGVLKNMESFCRIKKNLTDSNS